MTKAPGPTALTAPLPARLGRYTVVRRLGAGGMAEVFLSRARGAEGTDKLVVLKRILPAFSANARFRSMFVDEARVALRLNHPNVVQVFGFESDGPTLLLVMEHIDGPDLAALAHVTHARGEKLPTGFCAWIAREVARGLHYAHERKGEDGAPLEIVHRDVSPGNILLSYDGSVKLGDFGIAKARLVSDEDEGALKGKFQYMSPEQARTEPVDRRADVYSLGVVLTELLSGRPIYDPGAGSFGDLLPKLRRGEVPDVHRLAPGAPLALREIVATMVASKREDRFATARDCALALTRFLREQDDEWDAGALEQYLSRALPRASATLAPPSAARSAFDDFARGPGPDAQTQAQVPARAQPKTDADATSASADAPIETGVLPTSATPSRPPSAVPSLATLEAGLVRERVHVTVIVGRLVTPASSVDTLDTRPLWGVIEALAYKADATLERDDDERFVLVTGVLRPHVDHALRGARLALDLVEAATGLSGDVDAGLAIALGVARGVAAAARGAEGSLLGFDIVDESRSFATSLADAAAAGEVLTTAGLYRLARRAFVLSETASRAGVGARMFRLERAKTAAERDEDVSAALASLVGRRDELSALRVAFERVREARRGAMVTIVGELGVGKSALVTTFAQECERDPSAAVLRVPVAFGAGEARYRVVGALLAELLSVADDGDPRGAEAAVERAIDLSAVNARSAQRAARRAMRIAFRLDEDDDDDEATARELALVLRRLLAARAAMGPVLVVIDGLELADRPSRHVLGELSRRLPPAAVLLLCTGRESDPLERGARARESDAVTTLTLGPLLEADRAQLIAARLGAREVTAELTHEVGAVAGGNPLMILEVLEALGDRGRLEVQADEAGSRVLLSAAREGDLPLPATLEEVLAARVDTLPTEARALVRWCALVDAELPVDMLESLAGEDAQRAIGRLLSDGILVRSAGRRDVLTFAHAALARVARASVDPTQQAGMHARIAALLEKRPQSRGVGAALLARHREAAGAVRPAARAYFECASALRNAGQSREALGAYARTLELCAGTTDPEGYALRFGAHLGREEIARSAGWTRARRAEIVAMRAVAVESRDRRLIARALARQARYKLETDLGTGVERDVDAAVRAARQSGEARTEAEARRVLAVHLGKSGRYADALLAIDEALSALETRAALTAPPGAGVDEGVRAARTVRVEVLITKGSLLRQTGEIDRAIEVYGEAYAVLQRYGPRRLLAHVLNALGVACHSRGDYADALRLYLASIAVHRESGQRDKLGTALSNAGQCYAALGLDERARVLLRKAVDVFSALGTRGGGSSEAHAALAEVHAARGDTTLALAELERAREDADAAGSQIEWVRVRLAAAWVALARGDMMSARVEAEESERGATEAGIVMYAMQARAYAAEAAAALGDRAAARRHIDAVLQHPQFADPTRVERGDLLLRACERALRVLGDDARAARVARLSRQRSERVRAQQQVLATSGAVLGGRGGAGNHEGTEALS